MKLINIVGMWKTGKSIFRLIFLTVLLIGNVIGFHYYHVPVATENLKYVPLNSTFIFTINLKSISGSMLKEIIFNPEAFEKEVFSKSEKTIIDKNANLGLNSFGLISFFRFNYNNKVINGISLNLEDSDSYSEQMKNNNFETIKVDEVRVFYNDDLSHFVFEKAAVILFSPLNEKEKNDLAGQFLLHENTFNSGLGQGHFTFYTKKGLLENSSMAEYFRMMPDFVESFYVSGIFENGLISLNGKINSKDSLPLKEGISFGEVNKMDDSFMEFGFKGSSLSEILASYLNEKVDLGIDSTAAYNKILDEKYNGFSLAMKDVVLPFDLNSINSIMQGNVIPSVEYTLQMNLTGNSPNPELVNYNFPLPLKVGNDPKRKVFCTVSKKEDQKSNQAYFYFNPAKFMESANLNILVSSLIEPFMIFDEIILKGESFSEGELNFSGEVSFLNREKHSLVQLRQLIKDFTSIL